ncbi:MAG: nucleotidyltransferase domain-containing protein [Spirochaetales bacterium]|jgi:predicted nucleotidyltransferase|nr:nucleotidyltransferase domain-containing protein [Spirochaetales bacterium]
MKNDISGIQPQLDMLTKVIAETVPVEEIYLFGSWAYGVPDKDSDIDLYVVFKDDMPMRELDALDAVRTALPPTRKIPLDLLGLRINRFLYRKQHATLERKITREGIKIYG